MPYVDLITLHNPSSGGVAPASWGDQIRENEEALRSPPVCSVTHSVPQTTGSGGLLILSANTENFDTDGMHSNSVNNARITIQSDSHYLCIAVVAWDDFSTAGSRALDFRVDGTTIHPGQAVAGAPVLGANSGVEAATRSLFLTAGQWIEVAVLQNSGGNLDVQMVEFLVLAQTIGF